jgi:anti-sigma regulatory factor (Ser/Thr protein kinase)
VIVDGVTSRGGRYHGPSIPLDVDRPLPPPPGNAAELDFGLEELVSVRALVSARATIAGLATERVSDLVLAVNEVATNTVSHGAGHGVAHVWSTPHSVVCQVEDSGHITDPLAGRRTPEPDAASCVGLWTVNQLCDLVEVRTSPVGTVVRVHSAL